MGKEIATEEFQALTRCESVIEAGLHTFWEVGSALTEVRDRRLWAGQYDSFNDYLANRWKLKPAYAGQLMLAAGIRTELTHAATVPVSDAAPRFELPETIAGTCALRNLDTEQKIQVLEQLHEKALPVTRQNIRRELEEILPPPPKVEKFSLGILRNSIGALVRQSEFLGSVSPERVAELFGTEDDRELAVETLTRLVELLSVPEKA